MTKKLFFSFLILIMTPQLLVSQIISLQKMDTPKEYVENGFKITLNPTKVGRSNIDYGATIQLLRAEGEFYCILAFKSSDGSPYSIVLGSNASSSINTLSDLLNLCDEEANSFFSFKTPSAPKSVQLKTGFSIMTNHSVRVVEYNKFFKSSIKYGNMELGPLGEELLLGGRSTSFHSDINKMIASSRKRGKTSEINPSIDSSVVDSVNGFDSYLKTGILVFSRDGIEYRLARGTLKRAYDELLWKQQANSNQ